MSAELKETIENLGNLFEGFKKDIAARQEKFEKDNARDAIKEDEIAKKVSDLIKFDEAKEKLETAATQAAALKAKVEELEARLNEPVLGVGEKGAGLPRKVKTALERALRTMNADDIAVVHKYAAEHECKSLNLTEGDSGGVFYSFTHDNALEPMIREIAPLRQVCDVRTVSTSSYTVKKQTGNTDAGWVTELGERSETDAPTYAQQEIPTHECYAQPLISQKLLDDAEVDIERELNDDLAETFAELENVAFVSGNGVGRPRGMLTYSTAATEAAATVLHVATGASGDWNSTDPHLTLLGVPEKLKPQFLGNARWMMSRARLAEIMKWVDGDKNPIWQPSYQAGTPSLLGGFPVVRNEHMPAKAANSLSVAFGDFRRAYRIIDRIGMRMLRDPYTSKGFVKYYTTRRVGGDLVRKDAHLVIKFATT